MLFHFDAIENLRVILNHILPIDEESWAMLLPHLKSQQMECGDFLCRSGEICKSIAFIQSGSMRAYYTSDDLLETNLLLCSQNEFICDYESFITQSPAKYNVEAIERTNVIVLSKSVLDALYAESFYWNCFGRKVAEGIYLSSKARAEELLFYGPEERYLRLMRKHPEYFQKYALKHLAGYLGIAPQSLSRIRARLVQH